MRHDNFLSVSYKPSKKTCDLNHVDPFLPNIITRKQQSLHKQEMEAVLARQQQLEDINRRLGQSTAEVRKSFWDLDLSRDKYQELRSLPDDQMSLQEHVAVSLQTLMGGDGASGYVCGTFLAMSQFFFHRV